MFVVHCSPLISVAGNHTAMDEEVWGEEQEPLDRESQAVERTHFNKGFRDAVDEGQTEQAQAGFDSGFCASTTIGQRLGRLQGRLETLRIFAGQVSGTSEHVDAVRCIVLVQSLLVQRFSLALIPLCELATQPINVFVLGHAAYRSCLSQCIVQVVAVPGAISAAAIL